ncbi:MAG: zinc metalloprotease HtpX [Gammaproteobacteria bacterium]|nr:zinc metalloprotease HtpX [Gammaproteobacteria bacterium]MDH5802468.1 zinc metalloprotease HtpX [Gammaproteobacteria bacterium]
MQAINLDTWEQHAGLNRLQTLLLFAFMAGFLGLLGWILWGFSGIIILGLLALLFFSLNPALPPQLIMRLYQATPIRPQQAPTLYGITRELAQRAQLPVSPTLYYIPSQTVNAFTVGNRNQSVIAITDGLLRTLNTREQTGVLAHEISHIRNNDLRVMSLADTFSRLTALMSLLGQFLLLINLPLILFGMVSINWLAIMVLIFAPSVSALAQLGLSRVREYDADLNAARLSGDPEGLARALEKIETTQRHWLQRLFLPSHQQTEPSLLRTHPPTEERIRRLLALQRDRYRPIQLDPEISRLMELLNREAIRRRPRRHPFSGLWH